LRDIVADRYYRTEIPFGEPGMLLDVGTWLRGLGLERYEAAFSDNEIDWEALPKLTTEDLKDLGVVLGSHRRKLLEAIAALQRETRPQRSATDQVVPIAERRQLTVMFCDLVGSTALSARLDPEDLREVIGAYHAAVAEVIGGFDGFVAKYMGDGVLAYFGYPQAHEDDAERAVRAGLAVVGAVRRLQTPMQLQMRVGLATGLAVVGDLIGSGAAQEQAVVGETPNLAARLQALAEPDTVVIADTTRRLVGSLFEYQSLGEVELKGLPTPVPAFRVHGESRVGSRFEALRSGKTPLVGRDEEIELLRRRWEQAKAGAGRVVLISAEPGIGKSRLTEAFRESIHSEPHTRLPYFCSPHRQDSALFPFIGQLERAAGFERDDTPAARLDKLEVLVAANAPAEGDVQSLAELLAVPPGNRYPARDLTPQRKKEQTFEALLRQLAGLAERQHVLMIFEDLHWADPSSRELLDLIVEQIERVRVLLIATFRPEFQAPWADRPHVTTVALRRLGRDESDRLVRGLVGDAADLSGGVMDEIVERTDGVPLFLEELTKAVLENAAIGSIPATSARVPATLHASLMARLDRLGPMAKEIAQVGAAIGREFPYTLLAAVAQRTEAELHNGLDRLADAGLVFRRGVPPEASFLFKHALVQDTAYSMLLRGARQALHARIAQALESDSPELMDTQPELFAQHYAEAGLVEKAVTYWGKAGHSSAARSAIAEAAAQFQKALDQLALLPDTPERQRQELEFCSALGAALRFVKGQAAPETGQAYARARELWEQLDYPAEYLHIPYGQSRYHVYCGELDLALRLDEDLLRVSRQRNDSRGLVLSHQSCGTGYGARGRLALSRSHLEAALSLYDPNSHHSLGPQTGSHPQVVAQAYLGIVLLCLGFPNQALVGANAAIAEARRLAHSPTIASALMLGAIRLSIAGDTGDLDDLVEDLVAVATEQAFPQWRAFGTIYRGWVKAKNGDVVEGISLLRSGAAAYRANGNELLMPHHTALLARACDIAGQIDEALTALDDALQIAGRTGERWLDPELHRHKGQLLLRQGHTEAAEELYRKALSIAKEQQAKLWELRAAASLARLRCGQGRRGEARDLLTPVYGWFTEGFDTPDLKEAKALLDK
jgi:class 3 adenylate cyclase/predicted ATPase